MMCFVLVIGIISGLAHYFVNLGGGSVDVFARTTTIKEPRFPKAGLVIAAVCLVGLLVRGGLDTFQLFTIHSR